MSHIMSGVDDRLVWLIFNISKLLCKEKINISKNVSNTKSEKEQVLLTVRITNGLNAVLWISYKENVESTIVLS